MNRQHYGLREQTHSEHAAIARYILCRMSRDVGYNFADAVDCCGMVLWVWHRKMSVKNEGLKLIKPQERDFTDVPDSWREHIEVVTRRRRRVKPAGLSDAESEQLDSTASQQAAVPLGAKHNELIDWLTVGGWVAEWDHDNAMLRTHSAGLAAAHKSLGFKGEFESSAPGSDPSKWNCFAYSKADGQGNRILTRGKAAQNAFQYGFVPAGLESLASEAAF